MMYQINDDTILICTTLSGCKLYKDYEIDDISAKHMKVEWSVDELAKSFPQATKEIREMIKERKEKLSSLLQKEYEIKTIIESKVKNFRNQETLKDWYLEVEVIIPRKKITAEIARLTEIANLIRWYKTPLKRGSTKLDRAERVSKAKRVPINSLVEFNQAGFAQCLWHNEKTGSMKYYSEGNKVHCFGCGKSGDVIDVVKAKRNCSFTDAVIYLSNL